MNDPKKIKHLEKKRRSQPPRFRLSWKKAVLALGVLAVFLSFWTLLLPVVPEAQTLTVEVSSGQSAYSIGKEVQAQGVQLWPRLFSGVARLSGRSRQLKAGNYEVPGGTTTYGLVQLFSRGDSRFEYLAVIEGWNFKQLKAAIAKHPDLIHDSAGMSDEDIMKRLGTNDTERAMSPEGWFFPDTYNFPKRSSDFVVYERAFRKQKSELEKAWQVRMPDVPLQTPYEALVLASIVEKETGKPSDRPRIASVFANRLRMGMLLQTDPTVIYGLGDAFDGDLRRRHLRSDTPYNTYTRPGLPPTPIAMPGRAALYAAVRPEVTPFLYFVARGDGSSQFSSNLNDHNKAVQKYQLGRRADPSNTDHP